MTRYSTGMKSNSILSTIKNLIGQHDNDAYKIADSNGWFKQISRDKNLYSEEIADIVIKKYQQRFVYRKIKNKTFSEFLYRNNQTSRDYFRIAVCYPALRKKYKIKYQYIKWTFDLCKESALEFKTKLEWRKNDSGAYYNALKNGWIDECSKHFCFSGCGGGLKWTPELCMEQALKYKSVSEWCREHRKSYRAACTHGWLNECSAHFSKAFRWTIELCKESALQYKTLAEWQAGDRNACEAARRIGWMSECSKHFSATKPVFRKKYRKWTLELAKAESLKYRSRKEWSRKDVAGYNSVLKKGWMDECSKHFHGAFRWTIDICKENASKYKTKIEWYVNDHNAYEWARKHRLIDECWNR